MFESMERLIDWFSKHVPWLSFVLLGIAGGVVAHVRTYEQAKVDLKVGEHFGAIMRRSVSSGFAALLVWFAADGWGMRASPWAYALAGICGLFSAEAFDLAWRLVTAYLQGRVRISTEEKEKP